MDPEAPHAWREGSPQDHLPRDCYDACGIVAIKRGGTVTRVLGDPDHPVSRGALCGKCALAYNGVFRDPEVRLLTPLRRAGARATGASSRFRGDDAIGDIARALQGHRGRRRRREDRPRPLHRHLLADRGQLPMRFLGRLGAREVEPDTVCNMAGHVALDYVIGTSVIGFDPRTAGDANCILVWGAIRRPPPPHQHKHWLKEAPGTVIVVDPVRHPTAGAGGHSPAALPRQRRALAFAMIHVLVRENLIDRAFLASHTVGWEELEPAIAPCTPAWGEARTGVPAAAIEEAARIYGAGPALLWLGQGLQRQVMGGNVMRACALLPAVTGKLRQARRRAPLPQRQRPQGRERRLPERGGAEPESAELQPDGARSAPRGPGGHPGPSFAGTSTPQPPAPSRHGSAVR